MGSSAYITLSIHMVTSDTTRTPHRANCGSNEEAL